MSAVLPVPGEVWRFRHLPAGRGFVDILDVVDGRVQYSYRSTGVPADTDLTFFLRAYELAQLDTVDGGAS